MLWLIAIYTFTHCILNELPPHYILEETNFNFRYVRLCDLDILWEKWINFLQTVETLSDAISCSIWFGSALFANYLLGSPDYNGLMRCKFLCTITLKSCTDSVTCSGKDICVTISETFRLYNMWTVNNQNTLHNCTFFCLSNTLHIQQFYRCTAWPWPWADCLDA